MYTFLYLLCMITIKYINKLLYCSRFILNLVDHLNKNKNKNKFISEQEKEMI